MDSAAQWALIGSTALLGLGGSVHCAAMCGAACAAVTPSTGGAGRLVPFHLGRLAGYAAGGVVAAGGVQWLGWASATAPVLRPVWALLHAAALAYGLWLLVTARQPAFLARWGRRPAVAGGGGLQAAPAAGPGSWQVVRTPWTSAAVGTAWVAWPCGLLQSALLVAALADGPATGGLAMAVFAMASSFGLLAGPQLARWAGRRGGAPNPLRDQALRIAGLLVVLASGWALGHDLFRRVAAYCLG